jgi:type II secretory pathway pseudopilin PulG
VGWAGEMRAGQRAHADDDGYVAAETLIAMLIMSTAMAFGLVAFVKAQAAGEAARDLRRAQGLAWTQMHRDFAQEGEALGQTADFTWRTTLHDIGAPGLVPICQRVVALNGRSPEARRYAITALETCPPKASP